MDFKIQKQIRRFVKNYKIQNKTETDWNEPLIAFADANDPLFEKIKTDIIPFHDTPTELLNDARTVISYFIPFKEEIAQSNFGGKYCSKEWAIAYIETNKFISDLNRYLATELEKLKFKSVLKPPTYNFDKKTLISNWSHKHVAYISGLGKFGSHKMLITEKGCCGRLGTLITSAKIQPTKRPDKVIGMHFFNPASAMKLVEIVRPITVSDETVEASKKFAEAVGKTPVVLPDVPGFIVNRLAVPFILNAIELLENGIASKEDIDTAINLGLNHPMGPLTLADLIGNDVVLAMADGIYETLQDHRYVAPTLLRRMVDAGWLGQKTKKGFYDYNN